jgi:dihydroneopterin aldolase
MGLIRISGIRTKAFHGCLDEEAAIGGDYIVNVTAEAEFSLAEKSDELTDTVDYGRVTEIVLEEMSKRSKLIEHVTKRMLRCLQEEWEEVSWTVEVVKLRPPINGNVSEVSYTLLG